MRDVERLGNAQSNATTQEESTCGWAPRTHIIASDVTDARFVGNTK